LLLLARCERQGVNEVAERQSLEGPALRHPQHVTEAECAGHRCRLVGSEETARRQSHQPVAETIDAQRLVNRNAVDVGNLRLRYGQSVQIAAEVGEYAVSDLQAVHLAGDAGSRLN